eukprot:scaffold5061_cov378-Prasinococcus_capsulatus_cf.AAC.3
MHYVELAGRQKLSTSRGMPNTSRTGPRVVCGTMALLRPTSPSQPSCPCRPRTMRRQVLSCWYPRPGTVVLARSQQSGDCTLVGAVAATIPGSSWPSAASVATAAAVVTSMRRRKTSSAVRHVACSSSVEDVKEAVSSTSSTQSGGANPGVHTKKVIILGASALPYGAAFCVLTCLRCRRRTHRPAYRHGIVTAGLPQHSDLRAASATTAPRRQGNFDDQPPEHARVVGPLSLSQFRKLWAPPMRGIICGVWHDLGKVLEELKALECIANWSGIAKGRVDWTPGSDEPKTTVYNRSYTTKVIQRDRLAGAMFEEVQLHYSDSIRVSCNTELQSADLEGEGQVKLRLREDHGRGEFVEEADLVIGADGARATLRESLLEHLHGASGKTTWLDRHGLGSVLFAQIWFAVARMTTVVPGGCYCRVFSKFYVHSYEDTNPRMYKTISITPPKGDEKWDPYFNYSSRTTVLTCLSTIAHALDSVGTYSGF